MKHPSSFYFFRRARLPIALCLGALLYANIGKAQVRQKSVSFNAAYQSLNPEATATVVKTSVGLSSVNAQIKDLSLLQYKKQFTVFYGLPTTVAGDWFAMRFAVSLDSWDEAGYWSMSESQRNAADALRLDDFVRPSAYAAMRVSLDFRFAAPRPVLLEWRDYSNNGPVQGRKFFFIR